jgi:hypothetical protein
LEKQYKKITSAIQEHDQIPALSSAGGAFRDMEVEEYIGNSKTSVYS